MAMNIRDRIEETCKRLKLKQKQLFEQAYQWWHGKRKCARKEARDAYRRFASGRALKAKARGIIRSFLDDLRRRQPVAA